MVHCSVCQILFNYLFYFLLSFIYLFPVFKLIYLILYHYSNFLFYKKSLIKTKYFLFEKNVMARECYFWT